MLAVIILSWIATVWILLTYLLMNIHHKWRFLFNLANAVGAIPLGVVEGMARVWSPFFVTVSFGLIGLVGVIRKNHG